MADICGVKVTLTIVSETGKMVFPQVKKKELSTHTKPPQPIRNNTTQNVQPIINSENVEDKGESLVVVGGGGISCSKNTYGAKIKSSEKIF